ncbi:MAG: hypothetical protein JNG88_18385, partial [Phycisphaerales bacterium]|nr:hypothetical protein [Phycisphaerales bacterium]
LLWPDGAQLTQRIDGTGRAIVVVAERVPARQFWPDLPPPVVALSAIARSSAAAISIDPADLAATVQEVDAANRQVRPLALTPKQQKQVFRSAAADVLKSAVKDEDFVSAYREHGSYRKAAKALSERLGVTVSKDAVKRAVESAGGIEAVKSDDSSESVQRTVASQRRDRQRKFASPSQPPDLE